MVLIYLYIFMLGAIFGSFFLAVASRIEEGKNLLERSYCPNCNTKLKWYELVPIFSFIFLGGKCSHCNHKIPIIYFIIEIITGLLFALLFYHFGFLDREIFVGIILVSLLVIVSAGDILYMLVSDKVLLFFLPIIVVARILIPLDPIYDSLIGAAFGFGFLYFLAWYSVKVYKKQGMGGGDIKLYGIIGIVLGFKLTLLSIFIAALIGAIFGIIYNKLSKREDKVIPFVPFIAIGVMFSYLYGDALIQFYFRLLGI